MRVFDTFAGLGGFSLGFHAAGCETVAFSEIEPFPCSVLAHHWPEVPNLGDITKIQGDDIGRGTVDILTGGFPCQDVSVAGERRGLEGDRSGLFWEIVRLAGEVRPTWLVLENVPGLLSSNKGRDFGVVLHALGELGYGLSWRVLDAQHFGVPQRRRRVFIVGHLGGICPPEILFEPEGMRGDTEESEAKGQEVAGTLGGGSGTRGWADDTDRMTFVPVRNTAPALTQNYGKQPDNSDTALGPNLVVAGGLTSRYGKGVNSTMDDGAIIPTPFDTTQITSKENRSKPEAGDPCHPLAAGAHPPSIAFHITQDPISGETAPCLSQGNQQGCATLGVAREMAVRRLTPGECERLQGFPDGFTDIPGASDSGRYRALGNAVAVPVVEWIARRLVAVSKVKQLKEG